MFFPYKENNVTLAWAKFNPLKAGFWAICDPNFWLCERKTKCHYSVKAIEQDFTVHAVLFVLWYIAEYKLPVNFYDVFRCLWAKKRNVLSLIPSAMLVK